MEGLKMPRSNVRNRKSCLNTSGSTPPQLLARARKRVKRLERATPVELKRLEISAQEHMERVEAARACVVELRIVAQGFNQSKHRGKAETRGDPSNVGPLGKQLEPDIKTKPEAEPKRHSEKKAA